MSTEAFIIAAMLLCAALVLSGIVLWRQLAESRRLEKQFRSLFTLSGEAALVLRAANPDHFVVMQLNEAASELLPELHAESEFPSQRAKLPRVDNGFMQAAHAHLRQAVQKAISVEYETAIRSHINNQVLTCRVRLHPMAESGVVRHVICFIQDIKSDPKSEKTKPNRWQEFRMLVEQSPDTIAHYDRFCHRIYANPAFRRLMGVAAPSIIVNEYCGESYRMRLREVLESGQEDDFESTWLTSSGKVTSHIHLVPAIDASGNVTGVLSIGRDISAIKATENNLRESKQLLRELNARREAELRQVRKEVAREMHEDYGQRLSMLRMKLAMVNMTFGKPHPELGERIDETLQLLDETIVHMREIVSVIHPSVLNMDVSTALEWLANETLTITGIDFDVHIEEGLVSFDETTTSLVYRLVQSALSNVVRHAHASRVSIILARQGDGCRLEVRDDGKGFDLDRSKKDSMGMVAMEELANMLHGEIVFLSAVGKGTVIEVCFPAGRSLAQPAQLPV
ncbi:MAG: PAS domain-containing sensor histidine kinase [Sideroxydans sp.]|nr:PAS domain-containing sensor histidine kinase [Sideroxydans sp.]